MNGKEHFNIDTMHNSKLVDRIIQVDKGFEKEIFKAVHRFSQGDWGTVTKAIAAKNATPGNAITGKYKTIQGDILIVLKADRSQTIVMFPNELSYLI